MRVRAFDVAGVASVLCFTAVIVADLDALRAPAQELPVAVSAADRDRGFREGESWYGIYLGESKLGFTRVERRRRLDGYELRTQSVLRPTVLGRPTEVEMELVAALDPGLALEAVELEATSGGVHFSAHGRLRAAGLELSFAAGGIEHTTVIPVDQLPALDLTLRPVLLTLDPAPGQRFRSRSFDPLSLQVVDTEIEYLGRDTVEVFDEQVEAHVLRQRTGDRVTTVWVNDLGEVLQEEMPLGLVMLRESEAAATWGLGQGAIIDTPELEGLGELLSGLAPALGAPSAAAGGEQ